MIFEGPFEPGYSVLFYMGDCSTQVIANPKIVTLIQNILLSTNSCSRPDEKDVLKRMFCPGLNTGIRISAPLGKRSDIHGTSVHYSVGKVAKVHFRIG